MVRVPLVVNFASEVVNYMSECQFEKLKNKTPNKLFYLLKVQIRFQNEW